jgi:hypothetical protein
MDDEREGIVNKGTRGLWVAWRSEQKMDGYHYLVKEEVESEEGQLEIR